MRSVGSCWIVVCSRCWIIPACHSPKYLCLFLIVLVSPIPPQTLITFAHSYSQPPQAESVYQGVQKGITNYIYSPGFLMLSKRLTVILPLTWTRIIWESLKKSARLICLLLQIVWYAFYWGRESDLGCQEERLVGLSGHWIPWVLSSRNVQLLNCPFIGKRGWHLPFAGPQLKVKGKMGLFRVRRWRLERGV